MVKLTIDVQKQVEGIEFDEFDFTSLEIYEDLDEENIIFSTEGKKIKIRKEDFYKILKVFQPMKNEF